MELSCPISANRINETVVRIIAFETLLIGLTCAVCGNYDAMILLAIDFGIRAFTNGKLSLLKVIAIQVFSLFSFPIKMTDLAPKKFAAMLGFIFCLVISLCYVFNFEVLTLALTIVLLIFAILESIFSICVGCYFYTFILAITRKKTFEEKNS